MQSELHSLLQDLKLPIAYTKSEHNHHIQLDKSCQQLAFQGCTSQQTSES